MNQDKIWDYFQNHKDESFVNARSRLLYLRDFILKNKSPSPVKVLNVGVGDGTFEKESVKYFDEVSSLDPNESSIKKVRDYGVQGFVGYLENIELPKNYFSAIVASELFEHLTQDQLARGLKIIHESLKEDGYLLLTVPYDEDLSKNMVICPHCELIFHKWGHQRKFTAKSIRDLLRPYFKEINIEIKIFPSWSTLNWKGKIHTFFKLVLNKIGFYGENEKLFVHAKKKI